MKNIYVLTALVLLAITAVFSAVGLRPIRTPAAKFNSESTHYVAQASKPDQGL